MSDLAAPFDGYRDLVRPEWIDHNQHMNMGYYVVVFDFATIRNAAGVYALTEVDMVHAGFRIVLEPR